MHVRHVCQVTIYLHRQLAPLVPPYQHNVQNAVVLRRALPAIVDITWHLLARVLFVRISQTAIPVAKLLMHALLALVDIISQRKLNALLVRISQTAIPVTKLVMHVRHVSQVTIYRHPQFVPHVQQYQHNARSATTHRLALPAIVDITWHLLARALFVRISQTAIPVAKLLMHALLVLVDIISQLKINALLVRISQTAIPVVKLLMHALLALVDIISQRKLNALPVRISHTAVPVTKLLMHVRHVSQVTIYQHRQLVPHVQQYQHNARSATTHRLALPAILAIIWLIRRLVNCRQILVRLN
jgi:hypothetical protein